MALTTDHWPLITKFMKPSIPKGTRDFSPQEMVKRNYIFDIIRKVYQLHGYQPIETPAMENSETLMGKYGEEGDRLIFRIMESGDYLKNKSFPIKWEDLGKIPWDRMGSVTWDELAIESGSTTSIFSKKMLPEIVDKALRYDLTVPFARYVVQHRNDITFPFKRYQIQPVWRADRPQKGRYREFYQCDADVIGSDSLLNEVELIQIIDEVFTQLGVPVIIKINNRKILQGIAEYIGAPEMIVDIATAIDKVDKIGQEGMEKELLDKGFGRNQLDKLVAILFNNQKFEGVDGGIHPDILSLKFSPVTNKSELYNNGITELETIWNFLSLQKVDLKDKIEFDISLARGLNYYTGTIIEVKVDTSICNSQFTSSICGGGRYDDLTGIFGLPDVSGVGISFGADRIYDVMEELNLFPENVSASTKVLLINFGDKEAQYCLKVLKDLHTAGISAELYPDAKKLNKQFEYADKRNIPYVVLIGQSEIEKGVVKIRNMHSKEEKELLPAQLIEYFKSI